MRKRHQQAAKNVLMKDGSTRRVPLDQCEFLLESGQAKRYISNTIYRALKRGIKVKDYGTRDTDASLRDQIREARKAPVKKEKKDNEE